MTDWLTRSRWQLGLVSAIASLVAGWCLLPLVTGGWWLPRATALVAFVAIAGMILRAVRAPAPLQPLGQTLAMLLGLVVLFTPGSATLGFLPDTRTLPALRDLVAAGQADAWAAVPPASSTPGLLLLIVAGICLVFIMVDTLAAGLDLPGLAILPLGSLYVTPWLIGTGFPATWSFVVAMTAWLGVLAAQQADQLGGRIRGSRAGSAPRLLLVTSASLGFALLVGSLAPASSGLLRAQGSDPRGGGLVTLDEVVSMRRQLVSNDTRQVFSYRTTSDSPDYFRVAVLEDFDGVNWRVADHSAPWDSPRDDGRQDTYRLRIGPLNGPVVPSPAGTWQVRTQGGVGWDTRTGLPVRADGTAVADSGAFLRVTTEPWTPSRLRAASRDRELPPQGVLQANRVDPIPLVGDEVGRLARSAAAGTRSTYDAAVALQDWFTTDGGFRYSTEVPQGASRDDVARFLAERVGYCEQFAATMALMARALGIPARVVVGFTQGRPSEDDTWSVRASDAHAWPELWLGSAGWVRFEPTPRSTSVRVPSYAGSGELASPETEEPDPQPTQEQEPEAPAPSEAPLTDGEVEAGSTERGNPLVPASGPALLAILSLLLAPAAIRAARRRRRLGHEDPAAASEAAYAELVDTLIDLRLPAPQLTPRRTGEGALLATGRDPMAEQAVDHIVQAVEVTRYGPSPQPVPSLAADVRALRGALRHRTPRLGWLLANLIPRSLFRRRNRY